MSKKPASLIIVLLLLGMIGCGEKPKEARAKPETAAADPKRAEIQSKVDKTTSEGKEMIEKVKAMKPEVNGQISGKTLGEHVDDYSKNKGDFNIKPVGWEASQKKTTNNWKVVFYFQDYNNQYLNAEWEYNPETKKLYPFEFQQAPTFWTEVGAASANTNAKGKK